MAHLLMIESWVGGTGRLLPAAIARTGHRYTFVTRDRRHYLDGKTREMHPVFEHADHVLTTETNDVAALGTFLRCQHEVLRFDGVLTICDYYVDTVAHVAEALHLPHGSSSTVATARRKHLVRQALDRAGLPNPRYAITSSWEETLAAARRLGYPLVMKPSDLAASAFVRHVNDERDLHDAFASLERFTKNFRDQVREPIWLLEEYMRGEEVSVEACTYEGVTTLIGITDKSLVGFPYFVEDGHMFPAPLESSIADAITPLVLGALQAVGHDHGLSHTEVKLTPDGPRIVEINPRPGGNYIAELVERVTGIDLLAAQIDLALGRRPNLTLRETGIASAAIKFLVPPHAGHVSKVEGAETLDADTHIARWTMNPITETEVRTPVDNACYLGHVVAVDREGSRAREYAERAISRVSLTYADAPSSEGLAR